MPLTRRRFLLGSAALATTVAGLSACNASAGSDDVGAAPSSAPTGVEAGAYPVTIEHKFGSITLESAPQRVVTVGLKEQDDCVALGVVPVGSTWWFDPGQDNKLFGPWATQALGDAPQPKLLTDTDGIQFEQVAELDPDLIIGVYSGMKQEDYDKLTALAPTIAPLKEYQEWGVPWDAQAAVVGQALGRPQQMAQLIEDAKKRIQMVKDANPEFAGKTAMAATPWEGIFVYGEQDPRGRVLADLGFTFPSDVTEAIPNAWGGNISTERVELLDVDAIVWLVEENGRQEVEGNKAYASLPVHQEGREVFTSPGDGTYEAFSFLTVLSIGYLVEQLGPRLKNAVDGNPSTSS